jgi:flavin reductase (DIM6/NTAB) family NADH-FMN oxidoreductase RutF
MEINMKKIEVIDYIPQIIKEMQKGILLNTKDGDKPNTMTIGWGQIGIEWRKLIFTAYVRHGRYTHDILEKTKEFTVSIPLEERNSDIAKAIAYCGSRTGRDINKLQDCNLTLADGVDVKSPAIKEIPLTLECKVIYQQEQEHDRIPAVLREMFYPQQVDSDEPRANRDYHTVYYGEIVNAYILD